MSHAARLCHVCSAPVPRSDLVAGQAVTLLRRYYCVACSEKISTQGLKGPQRFVRQLRRDLKLRVLLPATVLAVAAVATILYAVLTRG